MLDGGLHRRSRPAGSPRWLCACAAVLLAWAVGCEGVRSNWERGGLASGSPRSGPRTSAQPPSGTATTQSVAGTGHPAPATNPSGTVPAEPGDYYQLVLYPDATLPPAPANFRNVSVLRAPVQSVADVLARLYVPVGYQGVDRCVILYATDAEWTAAAAFVPVLDAPPVTSVPATLPPDPVEAFRVLVGVIMANSRPGSIDRDALGRAAEPLERIAADTAAAPALRWAAAMLAGDLYANLLNDASRAEQVFLLAETQAPADRVERMNALYARARMLVRNGRPQRAEPLFAEVVKSFLSYRRSEVYQRCGRGLDEARKP